MTRLDPTSERGAVLVFTALAMMALVAMLVFVIDQGVLLVARGQAQNAADAGALAGAVSRAFDEGTGTTVTAEAAAQAAATANPVWDAPGVVRVSWNCPPAFSGSCVRVDVYRNGEFDSTPLPTVFGPVLNVTTQRVRATATAHVSAGNAANCVRPFALIGALPDHPVSDVGDVLTLRYSEIRLIDGVGDFLTAIRACRPGMIGLGEERSRLLPQPAFEADILTGIADLIALDPGASYADGLVVSPCANTGTCTRYRHEDGPGGLPVPDPDRAFSPRVVPIVLSRLNASQHAVPVVNILGLFVTEVVDTVDGPEISGMLVQQPGLLMTSYATISQEFGFLQVVRLLR